MSSSGSSKLSNEVAVYSSCDPCSWYKMKAAGVDGLSQGNLLEGMLMLQSLPGGLYH